MSGIPLDLKQQLSTILKKFRFEDLEDCVLPIFPEISWDRVKSRLVKNHESLTTAHAIPIIQDEISKANLSDAALRSYLDTLEVVEVSRHYKKRNWYAYALRGREEAHNLKTRQIENNIKDGFDVYHMAMNVNAVRNNDLVFVSIKEKRKKKQRRTIMPTHFALVKHENFFFCSKEKVMKNILAAVTEGLGYQTCKKLKLSGRDVPSLVQMLLNKQNASARGEGIKDSPLYKPAPPTKTPVGLDFTQNKNREQYAEKCYGEKPPVFESLKVKCMNQPWKHPDVEEKLPDAKVSTQIEFRSTNVPNFLKTLVARGILRVPLPVYAANVLNVGRNDMELANV